MIWLLHKSGKHTNYFTTAKSAALFMWGRTGSDWLIAQKGKTIITIAELNPSGSVDQLEKKLQESMEMEPVINQHMIKPPQPQFKTQRTQFENKFSERKASRAQRALTDRRD